MMRQQLVAAFAATLLVGAGAGYLLTQWLGDREAAATQPAERKVLYWHDPMKPEVRFDKPGKSPFMDMDLVPVYADELDEGDVQVSAAATQNLGVRLGKVERSALASQFVAVGTVTFDEDLLEVVQSRVEGYVQRLHVKSNLQPVRRGQPLADVVAPQWIAAQEEYLALLNAESARGREIRDAARARLAVLGVPEAAIRRLESARRVVPATTLHSPIDGVVTELTVREGAAIAPGAPLFRLNALHQVWAVAQVPETSISAVSQDAKVSVTAAAWPGERFDGQVLAILPDLDPGTRTLPVRVEIDNRARRLVPGMFVSLEFAAPAAEPQLVVPSEAVITTGLRSVVIVSRGDAGFDVREVRIGAESGGRTVILSGLEAGESIVLSGQFLIDSEASLKSTVSRLAPAPSPAAEPAAEAAPAPAPEPASGEPDPHAGHDHSSHQK